MRKPENEHCGQGKTMTVLTVDCVQYQKQNPAPSQEMLSPSPSTYSYINNTQRDGCYATEGRSEVNHQCLACNVWDDPLVR